MIFSGLKIKEIQNEDLPATAGQISIHGKDLIVPGWQEQIINIFKLDK